MALDPHRKPRRLRRGDQRELSQLKRDIEISKDRLFLINQMYAGSTWTKRYLVLMDTDQSYPVDMKNYGVYHFQWYIRKYEDCNKYPTMECFFCPEIRMKNQDGTLGNMLPVRPSKVQNLLQNNQTYVC